MSLAVRQLEMQHARFSLQIAEINMKNAKGNDSTVRSSAWLLGSLSSDVFERRTSTGSGRFALLSHDFEQIFGQIVSIRIKTLGNKNAVASRLIKREKGLLPVDVRRSKTSLLKLPIFSGALRSSLKHRFG